jgi:hypothetical protein
MPAAAMVVAGGCLLGKACPNRPDPAVVYRAVETTR